MNPMKGKLKLICTITLVMALLPVDLSSQSARLDVPYYKQGKDTLWAEELLGKNSSLTIRTHGCALTCISMITSHFSESSFTPSDLNQWLQNHDGFREGWEGKTYLGEVNIYWPAMTAFDQGYVYTRHDWKAQPADLVLIKYYLDKGKPVIAEVLYQGAPHYVVLTGYDENGFFMNDPEFPEQHLLNDVYNISDHWGSGAARNIYGIRVLYPTPSS